MSRLPDTTIRRDKGFIVVKIPEKVAAGMTQEYWDMLATNIRKLTPDVAPLPAHSWEIQK